METNSTNLGDKRLKLPRINPKTKDLLPFIPNNETDIDKIKQQIFKYFN